MNDRVSRHGEAWLVGDPFRPSSPRNERRSLGQNVEAYLSLALMVDDPVGQPRSYGWSVCPEGSGSGDWGIDTVGPVPSPGGDPDY
jgi:hypothetical protein